VGLSEGEPLARRLITTLSSALLAVALTTAAAAAEPTTPPSTPPSTTTGGEDPSATPTTVDATNTSNSTTTSTTTTTTTVPDPPRDCQDPDYKAIDVAQMRYLGAVAAAASKANEQYAELRKQESLAREALDAALQTAPTVESVEQAFAAAAAATGAYYDALKDVAEANKAAVREAGNTLRDELLRACEEPATVDFIVTAAVDGEIRHIDSQIQDTNREDALAALETEKAAALAALAPADDDNGGTPPEGEPAENDGASEDGQEDQGDGAGVGALPFAGTSALPLLIAGLALVGAGVAAVVLSRRRRDGEPSA
jgi:hypothetical protein